MPGCVLTSSRIEFAVAARRIVIAEVGARHAAAAQRLMRGERILLAPCDRCRCGISAGSTCTRAARRIFRAVVVEADGRHDVDDAERHIAHHRAGQFPARE